MRPRALSFLVIAVLSRRLLGGRPAVRAGTGAGTDARARRKVHQRSESRLGAIERRGRPQADGRADAGSRPLSGPDYADAADACTYMFSVCWAAWLGGVP